jgi:hypothetical protein
MTLEERATKLAGTCAKAILDLESISEEEDGCEHTEDGSGATCWHCREERYEAVVREHSRAALAEAVAEERRALRGLLADARSVIANSMTAEIARGWSPDAAEHELLDALDAALDARASEEVKP